MKRNAEATVKLLQYYRRGRSQNRNCSYVREKEAQASGVMKQIGEDFFRICYRGAACGIGIVLGGLTTTSEDPKAEENKKTLVKLLKKVDKEEARAEQVRKWSVENKSRVENYSRVQN